MSEQKKILQLLKTLPAPYNEQALINYDPTFYVAGQPINNNNDALGWGFDWDKSPEGNAYWCQLRKHLEFGEPLPPQPVADTGAGGQQLKEVLSAEILYLQNWVARLDNLDSSMMVSLEMKKRICFLEETSALSAAPAAKEEGEGEAEWLRREMQRHLPIIERAEQNPQIWERLTQGTGIATANGYRHALTRKP